MRGISPSHIKYVLLPRLYKSYGAVCADVHTEAPQKSDLAVHILRLGVRFQILFETRGLQR